MKASLSTTRPLHRDEHQERRTKVLKPVLKAPNRNALAAGDRVLIYVGAPEYAFIGHAEIALPVHQWSPEETAGYPGTFESGVSFASAEVWEHPLPMKTVLPQLELKETDPNARFFSGVVRISQPDYETVVAMGTGKAPPPPRQPESREPPEVAGPPSSDTRPIDVDLLFKTAHKLGKAGSSRIS
jgi:hypothetical protein